MGVRIAAVLVGALTLGASMPASASQTLRHRTRLGDWRLTIAAGKFSHDVRCRLTGTRMTYVAGAVGYRFARHLDTTEAWFRIDGGEARRWRDVLPALSQAQVAIDGRDLDAPTDGIVWLPVALVEDATSVAIQPRPDRRPRVFRMGGFAGVRDIARARGCVPEARFVD